MIRRIEVEGLGPHDDAALVFGDPLGVSRVSGSSEAGKSTLIDAVAFAFWGVDRSGRPLDLREVRDGANRVRVFLELANGATVERILNRTAQGGRGKITRSLRGQPYTTEKKWLGALATLGDNWPARLQVLVPFAWVRLAEGQGHGRPLRDLLASILPKADRAAVVRELLEADGHTFRRGDPIHEPDAVQLRTRANRDRDRAIGDVERLEALVAAGEAEATIAAAAVDLEAARRVVDLAKQWRRYDLEAEAHVEREEMAARQAEAAIEWDDRHAALGSRPASTSDAIDAALEQLNAASWKRRKLDETIAAAQRRLVDARAAVAALEEPRHPDLRHADRVNAARSELNAATVALANACDVCPTCNRDGWTTARETAEARVEQARAAVVEAETDRDEAAEALEAQRAADLKAAQVELEAAAAGATTAEQEHETAKEAETMAQATLAAAKADEAPALRWDRERAALGDRPVAPSPATPPEQPASARPPVEQVKAAREQVAEADRTAGARDQRRTDLGRLRTTLADATNHLEQLRAECDRLDALVDAVRRAPSEAARRQLSALGDLGPVRVVLRDDGGAEVLVDDRPWFLASTGRQLVADLWLRAGLRRAIGLAWLPMFVDCVQDVAGQPIPDRPPAILLETVDGPLTVHR